MEDKPTAISMEQDVADRFSDKIEQMGFVTEHIQVMNTSSSPPQIRQVVVRTPADGFNPKVPVVWEWWTTNGWVAAGKPRKMFDPCHY